MAPNILEFNKLKSLLKNFFNVTEFLIMQSIKNKDNKVMLFGISTSKYKKLQLAMIVLSCTHTGIDPPLCHINN